MKYKNIEELQLSSDWSNVMEKISDLAEVLTALELEKDLDDCVVDAEDDPDCLVYTEEAQEIYNHHYDVIETAVFESLNLIDNEN